MLIFFLKSTVYMGYVKAIFFRAQLCKSVMVLLFMKAVVLKSFVTISPGKDLFWLKINIRNSSLVADSFHETSRWSFFACKWHLRLSWFKHFRVLNKAP